jgi:hypothetical protein
VELEETLGKDIGKQERLKGGQNSLMD